MYPVHSGVAFQYQQKKPSFFFSFFAAPFYCLKFIPFVMCYVFFISILHILKTFQVKTHKELINSNKKGIEIICSIGACLFLLAHKYRL